MMRVQFSFNDKNCAKLSQSKTVQIIGKAKIDANEIIKA